MADRRKLMAGILNLPESARKDLAQRAQDVEREGVVGMLRKATGEMYNNPIVNTAIGFTPGVGDVQAAGETFAALQRGAPWQETAGYAVGMLPFVPALRTTWHGSPHGFTKFDMSKIGTGEGAQAYGHGLYLAESPDVARSYRDNLTAGLDVKKYDEEAPQAYAARLVKQWGSPEQAAYILTSGGESMPTGRRLEFLNAIQDGSYKNFTKELPEGYLYKVELPDEQIAKMLDWDKPLSEQAPEVQQILSKMIEKKRAEYPNLGKDPSGNIIYQMLAGNVGTTAQKQASEMLNQAGIPGIQYLDQASRDIPQNWTVEWPNFGSYDFPSLKEAESFMKENPHEKLKLIEPAQQTRNYVVFSDEIPQILERNNQPVGMFK